MAGVMRRHRRLGRAKRGRLAHLKRWRSRASGVRGRDRHPRSPRPLLRWHRQKSLPAPKKDRQLSFICLNIASKPNADRTEVCLAPSVDYNTLIARHPCTCAHSWSTHVTAPVRARGRSERVGARRTGRRAVLRHATRRCGVRAGMVCGRGRLEERAGQRRLPHTSMTKLASAFACFGRENQRTIPRPAPTITTRPAVSCAESRSRCILGSWPAWPPWPPLIET